MTVGWDAGGQVSGCYQGRGGRGGEKKLRCCGWCALGISCLGFRQWMGGWEVESANS